VIALIDYGAGNLTSVRKALATLGAEFQTPAAPADLDRARGVIVPGVGHFASTAAIDREWRAAVRRALDRGAALFGICLGMQWLFEGSTEAPDLAGFGVLAGVCDRLPGGGGTQNLQKMPPTASGGTQFLEIDPTPFSLKVPHVGWNALTFAGESRLMEGVASKAQAYFTHSYVAPPTPAAVAVTTHGIAFTSAVEQGRVAGVQFHPEKSGAVGLRILENWLRAL
jgi:imidazole glycerol-phosphate synthase subunit HisH